MIDLVKDVDYVYMMLIAAAVGAFGGLGAELLLQRGDNTGAIEIPGPIKGTRFFDIGFPASLIIGAIAAVAILYFFPPVVETITTDPNGGPPTTAHQYDVVKLVALSLIVGSAGPAFLTTTQSRLMSALNAQKTEAAVQTGKSQVDQVVASAAAALPAAVQQAVTQQLPDAESSTVKAIADAAADSLRDTLQPQVTVAHQQIEAMGQSAKPGQAD